MLKGKSDPNGSGKVAARKMAALLPVLFCIASFLAQLANSDTNGVLLSRVMDALENLAQYFQLNFHDLNIDGLFGIRVLEGESSKT